MLAVLVGGLALALAPDAMPGATLAPAAVDAEGDEQAAKPRLARRKRRPWIKRWGLESGTAEVSAFGGLLLIPRTHELFRPRTERPEQGFIALRRQAPMFGARLAYYPLRFAGVEAEGWLSPTRTDPAQGVDDRVTLFGAQAQVVFQLPYTLTPFILGGGGARLVTSDESALGADADAAVTFGGGVKLYAGRWMVLRGDVRDTLTPRRGVGGGATHWLEATLSIGAVFGRQRDYPKRPPPPKPATPEDSDRDGWFDQDDACPDDAGVEPDGCPPPPDGDADGFQDARDECPEVAGVAPNGCPDLDADNDGILIDVDACPDAPETHNGFVDADGCPDEIPEEIIAFEGTLQGVTFALGSAELDPGSQTTLDSAVAVMQRHPLVRVEISGHTDATGARDRNMSLSEARARAVAEYMTTQGVAASRIQTRGAGPDEPIDSNTTDTGRANNRRIEFSIVD